MTLRMCAAFLICAAASPALARTIYVDKSNTSGNQDGLSWETAFNKLQDAINAADASTQDEIWVADGVYDERRPDPDGSLVLKASVPLYGGFAGGETQRSQRDWIANPAVIDGLDQRNGLNPEAVHVIKGAEDATLDGFIVRNGDGFGASTFPKDRGGAIFANGVSMNIVRCRFERNKSRFGGAIYFNVSQSTITDCVFEESLVDGFGGAIFINSDSTLLIENCMFRSNVANKGGAIYIASPGNDATIRSCQFLENTALSDGGAGIFVDNASALIESCRFFDNFSEGGGAAIFNFAQSSPDIINCIFAGNESRVLGGAIHNLNNAQPRMVNCTITENTSGQQGGAISNEGGSVPILINSILWANTPDQIADRDTSTANISFSIIQGGFAGEDNIDADPLFVDPVNRNFHLLGDSPGISAGTLDGAPDHDIDGVSRPQGPVPDIGAFEQGPDSDLDGIPDFIEGQDDPDGDTIPNDQDTDSDGDSISDLNEGAVDSDSDGVADYLDLDSDDDGITDADETTNGLNQRDPSDAAADRDGDGITNANEINIHATRIDDADTDNDLMNDGYEVRSALDPLFNDAALDPDGDGLRNLLESLIDTDPFDPNDPVDDVFVAPNGNDTTGTGSDANPWKTISFAVDSVASVAADFHSVTIHIGPGTYTEQVVLEPNIVLAGASPSDPASTTIQFFDANDPSATRAVLRAAQSTTIRDLRLTFPPEVSIAVAVTLLDIENVMATVDNILLDGNFVQTSTAVLVTGAASSASIIQNCFVRRVNDGVWARNSGVNITQNYFNDILNDAIFVLLPDTKQAGAAETPLLGSEDELQTTAFNHFSEVGGQFVRNAADAETVAQYNDWGTNSEAEVAAKMTGDVEFEPILKNLLPSSISGVVLNADTNEPIASNARIELEGVEISADEIGVFSIPNASPGTYNVTVHADGFQSSTAEITVLENHTFTHADFALTPGEDPGPTPTPGCSGGAASPVYPNGVTADALIAVLATFLILLPRKNRSS